MNSTRKGKKTGRFSLGGQQAEADPLLKESFFDTAQYDALSSRESEKCFVVGRTGSGKSAMLQQIVEQHEGHVIRITPEDLSLPYICDSGAVKLLKDNEVHLAPFFIALWKHVFLVEIIKHRYAVKSPDAKRNFFTALQARISQDKSKVAALDYLDDFQDRFWCETDERVREITDKLEQQVRAEGEIGGAYLGAKASSGISGVRSIETKTEITDRYQKIVNQTQLPRLNKMISVLDEDILDSPHHFTWVVIDDLDRDWVDEVLVNELILCLFRAVVDLKRVANLKVLVALRSNIFHDLDFAGKVGAQEEKFRSLTMQVKWPQTDMEGMLNERVRVAAGRAGIDGLSCVQDILPNRNAKRGDPLKFVLRRTMMRPRDAISFLNACHELSGGEAVITWDHLQRAEQSYSNERLMALRDEWKPSYPGLDAVLAVFVNAPAVMSPAKFQERLEDISLLLASSEFSDRGWLMDLLRPVWEGTANDILGLGAFYALIELLYEIGFIGVRQATPAAVFAQDQPDLLQQHHAFTSIAGYVVHPIFWAGLGINDRRADI